MNHFPPLIAAIDDLIKLLVGLVFLVIWILSHLGDAKKKQAAMQLPEGPPRPQPPEDAALGQPEAADKLRAQVDDFLRQAAQPRPQGAKAVPQAAGRDDIVVLLDEPPTGAPAGNRRSMGEAMAALRAKAPKKPPRQQKTSRERPAIFEQQNEEASFTSVSQHVAEHVDASTRQMSADTARLGERVKQADEQFDQQLQQKFDHELGGLGARHAARMQDQQQAPVGPSAAQQIATLLASGDGIRQAIVLNEILRRPSDRW